MKIFFFYADKTKIKVNKILKYGKFLGYDL